MTTLFQKLLDRGYEPYKRESDQYRTLEWIRQNLFMARRFTVDGAIAPIVQELANTSWDKQGCSREVEFGAAILPGPLTWIELAGVQAEIELKDGTRGPGGPISYGWLLEATDTTLRRFVGAYVMGMTQHVVPVSIRGEFGTGRPYMEAASDSEGEAAFLSFSWWSISTAAVICCLLASPKVHTIKTHHFGPRHAKARIAKRKEPLLSWSEISIRMDQRMEARAASSAETGRRVALHQVKSFWRIRLGKVEYVRAHLRGSAEVGLHRTDVRMTGEPTLVIPPDHP